MRYVSDQRLVLLLLAIVWVELAFLPFFSIGDIKPNFFFIFIAFYAFRINWKRVATLAFFVGLIQDVLTNSFFGLETASCVGGAWLLRFFAGRLDRDKRWIQFASLFAFSWASLLLFAGIEFLIVGNHHFSEWILTKTFLISVYTTLAGTALFPLLEKLPRGIFQEKQYELF